MNTRAALAALALTAPLLLAAPAEAGHASSRQQVQVCTTKIGNSHLRSQAMLQTSTNPRFPMRGYVTETTGAGFPGRITAKSSAVLYDRNGRAVHRWRERANLSLYLNRTPQRGDFLAVTTRWTIWVGHVAPLLKTSCGIRFRSVSPR